jgi:hypothetical protein
MKKNSFKTPSPGDNTYGGKVVVNPSGGLISKVSIPGQMWPYYDHHDDRKSDATMERKQP